MIILMPTDTLRVTLDAAPASECEIWASWADEGTAPDVGRASSATTGTTPVTVVSAPAAGHRRIVRDLSIHNPAVDAITATVSVNDGVTTRTLYRAEIGSGKSLVYDGQWTQLLNWGTMAGEDAGDYSTTAQANALYDPLGAATAAQTAA